MSPARAIQHAAWAVPVPSIEFADATNAEVVVNDLPKGVYDRTVLAEPVESRRYDRQAWLIASFRLDG
ncbi:hypothetical protein ACFPTO_23205 [Paraburkholderia denitrificans]|uniref:Uncharacterized protein n=1 Tax=Paraburkholderia denitrificans TaxID=694025 RepID=A0ABW0JEQ7_9BURK